MSGGNRFNPSQREDVMLVPPPSDHPYRSRFSAILASSAFPSPPTGGHAVQGVRDSWRSHSYEDRVIQLPFPFTRIPSAVQFYVVDDDLARSTHARRRPPSLPTVPSYNSRPGFEGHHHEARSGAESKLSKEEQNMALSKLRKVAYNPSTLKRPINSRSSHKVRDWAILSRRAEIEKNLEDSKRSCAVCLEDFEPNEVVTLTPCNHMFHDDCIVPWVKDQARCPVCRCAFIEPMRDNRDTATSPDYRNYVAAVHRMSSDNGLLERDLVSLARTMEANFGWDAVRLFR